MNETLGFEEIRYYVKDMNTSSGTYLDGELQVTKEEPGHLLYDGMTISLGGKGRDAPVTFKVEVNYLSDGAQGAARRRQQRMDGQAEEYVEFKRRQ